MQLKCVNLLQESRNTTFIAIHNKDAFLSYLELLKPKIIVSLPKNVHVPHCDLVLEFHRFTSVQFIPDELQCRVFPNYCLQLIDLLEF